MKTALIVDDSAVIRKVARRILELLDFTVRDAEDGQKGLDLCQQEMPDVVFADVNMPGMDGYAFLKALRASLDGGKPKVLFCTTENEVGTIARARHAGADDYLMKPFDRQLIASKLEQFGWRLQSEAA